MNKIKITVLETALSRIITKLKSEEVSEIELTQDYYRLIPTNLWDVTQEDGAAPDIGSLVDDLEEIEKLSLDKNRPCTYVDFDRVASLLRFVSEARNPSKVQENIEG